MVVNAKLIVPVLLGASIVTVSALVAYYLWRKDEEEERADGRTLPKVKTSRYINNEVAIPKNIVPGFIGRGGSNIKDLEKKSGANLHMNKKSSDAKEDMCVIRGSSDAVQLAETLIYEYINNQPNIEETIIEIPQWACGRVIGTGGESIHNISHVSGAKVNVSSGRGGDQNQPSPVTIKGTKQQIQVAKAMIDKCVAQERCRREMEASKRAPRGVHSEPERVSPPVTANHPGDASSIQSKHDTSSSSGIPGATLEVYVSAVSSPSRFWVQLVGKQVARLDAVVDQMMEYYSKKENRELHKLHHVLVGQVVAAVFRHDGKWYRAKVMEIRQNEFDHTQQVADVFFVDYGDSEYVAVHELCELRADFLTLRFQALECFLAGVTPAGLPEEVIAFSNSGEKWEKWNPKAIERFEELTQVARWKTLVSKTCAFRERRVLMPSTPMSSPRSSASREPAPVPGIRLFDRNDGQDIDIGGVLLNEGWAVKIEEQPLPASMGSASSTPIRSPSSPTPFGDLGSSRVLGMMLDLEERGDSEPRDARPDSRQEPSTPFHVAEIHSVGGEQVPATILDLPKPISTAQSSGLDEEPKSPKKTEEVFITTANLKFSPEPQLNGSVAEKHLTSSFLDAEREGNGPRTQNRSSDALNRSNEHTAMHVMDPRADFKAKINRTESHQGSVEAMAHQK